MIAVHGLHGDREDTWTTNRIGDDQGRNWLKDLLQKHYPGSRILAFGYDASATRAGILTMGGIREKALQLLDDLIQLRQASDPVRAMSCPRYRIGLSESARELIWPNPECLSSTSIHRS